MNCTKKPCSHSCDHDQRGMPPFHDRYLVDEPRAHDEEDNPIELTGTGLLARCLQHETDHLNGTVFGDRLGGRSRKKLYQQHKAVADNYPDDWPVTPRVVAGKPQPDEETA